MTTLDRGLVLGVVLFVLGACDLAWSQSAPTAAASGKRIYISVGCFTCHGRSGQGGNFNYPAPALARTSLSVEAFRTIVRAGPNEMPAYQASVLSDEDLADIRAFLRSLPGRRPVEQIPLLNQ